MPHAATPTTSPTPPTAAPSLSDPSRKVHRIEVRTRQGLPDPRAASAASRAKAAGLSATGATTAKVYLVEGNLSPAQLDRIMSALLADPVTEVATLGAQPNPARSAMVEVHPLPGVMDPAAQSVQHAIEELVGGRVSVTTATRYDFAGAEPGAARAFALRALANPVVHQVVGEALHPASLPQGHAYVLTKRTIPLRGLSDAQLTTMSREAHLFLSLAEMRAVQVEYQRLGRDPSDVELETIAQTWSEHCVHKTLKATVRYTESGTAPAGSHRPGHAVHADGSITINNLLKSTVAAATHELIAEGCDWTLSVFKDNSGVIAFDDDWGVNIKVETHNRPSAIEPYGGAATGIGGCIRDVIATGLGAKPIASTDVFCVADEKRWRSDADKGRGGIAEPAQSTLPPGTLHPRRVLQEVVAGVRDYGNRMGIPTVSGGVHVDDRYVGNPLVFCGCIGLIPRSLVKGQARAGDRVIALGGRTGRDGIHGATFSSAELQHTASTEFAHAVQIGNAIEEKRLLDAILRARDGDRAPSTCASPRSPSPAPSVFPLFSALTDCGAGGFSSAIGEMASALGAHVHLDKAPVKYAGLSYTEVWISEAQERIVLAVPQQNLPALQRICDEEGVELADLGTFGTPDKSIILSWQGEEVGRLSCDFLHEGVPMPTREATWKPHEGTKTITSAAPRQDISASLLALLAHPTIASKHWIIRQYDHEVQGNTIVKPLVGPRALGPGDASVVEPVPGARAGKHHAPRRAIAISQGLQTQLGDPAMGGDPYHMALAAIDECVRNLVCVGADPARTAILDNFCWPSCDQPRNMGALVRACWGCYDGAKAYRTPFVSGKDSLSNQLRYIDPATGEQKLIEIPYTLLITGLAIVPDAARCITMDAKSPGNIILLAGRTQGTLRASLYASLCMGGVQTGNLPSVDLVAGPATARAIAALIVQGTIRSAHDCSEGGSLVALSEMLIAGHSTQQPIGASIDLAANTRGSNAGDDAALALAAFDESPSRYLLEIAPADELRVTQSLTRAGVPVQRLATLNATGTLTWPAARVDTPVEALTKAWRGTLDW